MNLTRGINLRKIAEMMPGASGAEVKVMSGCGYQRDEINGVLSRKESDLILSLSPLDLN